MTITNSIPNTNGLTDEQYILSTLIEGSGQSQRQSETVLDDSDDQSTYTYSPEELKLAETYDAYGNFQFLANERDFSLEESYETDAIQDLLDQQSSETLDLWDDVQAENLSMLVASKAEAPSKDANASSSRKNHYSQRHEISGDILSIENELVMFENGFSTAVAADIVQSQQNDLMEHLESVKHPTSSETPIDYSSYKADKHKSTQRSLPLSTPIGGGVYRSKDGASLMPDERFSALPSDLGYYDGRSTHPLIENHGSSCQAQAHVSPNQPAEYEFLGREHVKGTYDAYQHAMPPGNPEAILNMENMKAYMANHSTQVNMNYFLQQFGENPEYSPGLNHPYLSFQHSNMKAWYGMGHLYPPYTSYPLYDYPPPGSGQSSYLGRGTHSAYHSKNERLEDLTSKRVAKVQKKKNVGRACVHCKKAHLACDESRPCKRCVHLGKSFCIDVEHKRRGRPKLSTNKKNGAVPMESPNPLLETL
ncbi:hypothetical protein K493DRAFT_303261 [Basidiobolus meristosporus CBS 931.73]|uniref:Zn(2)-C6 fungal-type domain-containing protein n=1 Tax=Basidiobolus meristosporus CBS 931.73 TaxID=1314790 RepID=A0A1Y1Y3E0_9FUNG|nr:hypothetical protein K493DRAFT_303261 [Basidiobolus meristosporus CBS 931.73]|eukprot:ORX92520.1 hypothetical protein K493DRAFT_303261 [Basidiobolus meristosporus CBS 931.73]